MPIERNPMFKGRKAHLRQIHECLCPPWNDHDAKKRENGQVVVLYGLGGMGKTQLALTYASEQQDHFSAILWIDGSSRRNMQLSFRRIAQRYVDAALEKQGPEGRLEMLQQLHFGDLLTPNGRVTSDDAHLSEITNLTICFLEREGNNNWLLVLDNVDDLQDVEIVDFLPKTQARKVIITTRLAAAVRLGHGIEVSEIEEEDAVQILLTSGSLRTKTSSGIQL
jgi:AAA ATPase domain